MDARPAAPDDLAAVVTTISLAFHDDPTWSWAFPDAARRQEQYEVIWGIFIGASLRQGGVWMTPGCEAATVWIPPGGEEMNAEEEEQLDAWLHDTLGPRARDVLELFDRFEAAHPHDREHWYLSLLGTHPDHRGKGIGMALLASDLARFDAAGLPTYLESSNPANDKRYEAIGYKKVGAFSTPDEAHTLATMWREPK